MTMMHTITVVLDAQAATIQRLLGVVRRRGFELMRLDVSRTCSDGLFQARLRVRGSRRAETLIRQIANIVEVQQVALIQAASIRAA
ncbi:MAG: hypothetical protein CMJ83_01310 [Planctomycetes bacterium]|nr:hypothetical protein [Planctomycetota bacterium]